MGGAPIGHLSTPDFGVAITRVSDGGMIAGQVRSDYASPPA